MSEGRKRSCRSTGEMSTLERSATAPKGATSEAGANPYADQGSCMHQRTRFTPKRRDVQLTEKVAKLAYDHQAHAKPPQLAPEEFGCRTGRLAFFLLFPFHSLSLFIISFFVSSQLSPIFNDCLTLAGVRGSLRMLRF